VKVHLEADPRELLEKGPELIQKLALRLGVDLSTLVDPEEVLQKAAPAEPQLHHKAMAEMQVKERAIYEAQMKAMLDEIGAFLNTSMKTPTLAKSLREALLAKGYKEADIDHPRGVLFGLTSQELETLVEG
jgi:ABC-type hemin transport system substrate-binding protein